MKLFLKWYPNNVEEQMQGFDKFLKNAMERQRGTADYAVVTKRGNK